MLMLTVFFAGDGGRLAVADVAMKSFKFRLVAVYAPNIIAERFSFFVGWRRSWMIRSGWVIGMRSLIPRLIRSGGKLEGREGVKAALSAL